MTRTIAYDLWACDTRMPGTRYIVATRLRRDEAHKLAVASLFYGMPISLWPRKRALIRAPRQQRARFDMRRFWQRPHPWRRSGGPCPVAGCTHTTRYPFPCCPRHRHQLPDTVLAVLLTASVTDDTPGYVAALNAAIDLLPRAVTA